MRREKDKWKTEVERGTRNASETELFENNRRETNEETAESYASRPRKQTQPNKLAVIPEQT